MQTPNRTLKAIARINAGLAVALLATAFPAGQEQWKWPEKAENLQVLPEDFPAERLRAVMTGFSRTLGVPCSHCHVGEEGRPLSTFDFASDENPRKATARTMLKMLGSINDHLEQIEPSGSRRVNMWCGTCHAGRPRPTTLREALHESFEKEGIEAAVRTYRELRERYYGRGAYDFGESSLNSLGYQYLRAGKADAAIAIFRLNLEHHPDSWNAHDSLAEAYAAAGRTELAIAHYQQSLILNPGNDNGLEKLNGLRRR